MANSHKCWRIRVRRPKPSDFEDIELEQRGELFVFNDAHQVERFSVANKIYRFVLEGVSTFGSNVVYPLAVCYEDGQPRRIEYRILYESIPRRQYRNLTRQAMKHAFSEPGFQRLKEAPQRSAANGR